MLYYNLSFSDAQCFINIIFNKIFDSHSQSLVNKFSQAQLKWLLKMSNAPDDENEPEKMEEAGELEADVGARL